MKGVSYLVDELGNKTAVLLDLKKHRRIWEDLHDRLLIASRRNEPRLRLQQVTVGHMKRCTKCGSKRIRPVKRDVESRRGGTPYVAKGIEVEECPDCGERLLSADAILAIAAQRPALKPRKQKRTA